MQINQLELTLSKLFPFFDPAVRLFYIYLIPSAFIALLWAYTNKKNLTDFKNYIQHPSHRVDLQLYIINIILKVFLFGTITFTSFSIATNLLTVLYKIHDFQAIKTSYNTTIVIYSIITFIIDDFLRFINHYYMHKIPFLWKFHRVHHSSEVLSPLSLYRAHPLEVLLAMQRNVLSTALTLTIINYFFESRLEIWTVFGVNGIGFFFNLALSNLRHSHIPISFGPIEHIFISPKQHQVHHSAQLKHFNKNYGVSLSIWDKLFGSLVYSKDAKLTTFGLGHPTKQSIKDELFNLSK